MFVKRLFSLVLGFTLGGCATSPQMAVHSAHAANDAPAPITVRIAALNDFHGNLEPLGRPMEIKRPSGEAINVPVGGAAALGAVVAKIRRQNPYSLAISAGDLISASPLVSSYFLDEPAIAAMNKIGLDFNAVGNHEFDRGWQELRRMQDGGCAQHTARKPCQLEPFKGADFAFLAANVRFEDSGKTLFRGSEMVTFGAGKTAIKLGIIGLTLKDTANLVTPSGVAGLSFADEASAINAEAKKLRAQGADALVVAIHQGLYSARKYDDPGCDGVDGPLMDIMRSLDPGVDLIISGHTHNYYICNYGEIDPSKPTLITSAGYGGAMVTDIALDIDPVQSRVVRKAAAQVVVEAEGEKDAQLAAYVARYKDAIKAVETRIIGRLSTPAPKGKSSQESALGNLIADAQLAALKSQGAEIAFMNSGGIRSDLAPDSAQNVRFGQVYAVQPFGNIVTLKTLTGAQIYAALEQQFPENAAPNLLAPSQGFGFVYDMRRPRGSRIIRAELNGVELDRNRIYRVAINSFLASGGDGFSVFAAAGPGIPGPSDLDAMEAYLSGGGMRETPPIGRITRIDPQN